jgi:hypothetical protein
MRSAPAPDDEEADPEQGGDDVRRPELLRLDRVVLAEVDDRAAEAALDRGGRLGDDRPDDRERRGDPEGREQERQGGRHLQLPEDLPAARGVGAHQLDRAGVCRLQPSQPVDGHREEREIRGEHRDGHPVRDALRAQADHDHRGDREQRDRLRGDDVRDEAALEEARLRQPHRDREPEERAEQEPDHALLGGEERRVPEDVDQPGAVDLGRLEQGLHDPVQVRHRHVVDRERPGQLELGADRVPALPEPPEDCEHEDEHAYAVEDVPHGRGISHL